MNIDLVMFDKSTGEVLWSRSTQYACNFERNDAGRKLIMNMIDSAIKGCRVSKHRYISCHIDLLETAIDKAVLQPLPFDVPDSNKSEVF